MGFQGQLVCLIISIGTVAAAPSVTDAIFSNMARPGRQIVFRSNGVGDQTLPCIKEGFFPNPKNCSQFYRCVDYLGTGQVFSVYGYDCPKGHVFITGKDTCVPGNCPASGRPIPPPPSGMGNMQADSSVMPGSQGFTQYPTQQPTAQPSGQGMWQSTQSPQSVGSQGSTKYPTQRPTPKPVETGWWQSTQSPPSVGQTNPGSQGSTQYPTQRPTPQPVGTGWWQSTQSPSSAGQTTPGFTQYPTQRPTARPIGTGMWQSTQSPQSVGQTNPGQSGSGSQGFTQYPTPRPTSRPTGTGMWQSTQAPGQTNPSQSGTSGSGTQWPSSKPSGTTQQECREGLYRQHGRYCNVYQTCNSKKVNYACDRGSAFDFAKQMCRLDQDGSLCQGKRVLPLEHLFRTALPINYNYNVYNQIPYQPNFYTAFKQYPGHYVHPQRVTVF